MIDVDRHRARFADVLAGVAPPGLALAAYDVLARPALDDIAAAVGAAVRGAAVPRGRVAVAVGSRGIARLPEVVAALVRELRGAGATPFVVPAMGSHGASTAAGQVAVLAHLGIDESSVGAPIEATMETVEIGRTPDGLAVYIDRLALAADAIVVVNRVKPHTSFRGLLESGPAKMLAIGLGKADGARSIHALGWGGMAANVPAAARIVLETGKVAFALALSENADDRLAAIEAISADRLLAREAELLEAARAELPRLPFERIDVLIVDQVGKAISGTNADPGVTGRHPSPWSSGGPAVERLVFLDFAPGGDGNGNGVGLADVVTSRLAARYDPLATYLNALTTTAAPNARLPMVMPDGELAYRAALKLCAGLDPARAVVVRIADTLHLRRMRLSAAALAVAPPSVHSLGSPESFAETVAY